MKTSLDKTIKKLLDLRNNPKGTFGVEVEMEGRPTWGGDDRWLATRDYSLRGDSMEYVFTSPLNLPEAISEVRRLYRKLEERGGYVNDSMRAGVHIHVNFLDNTLREVMTFLAVYYSLEDCLVANCGEEREGNLFCLRMSDADYVNALIMGMLNSDDIGNFLYGNDNIRYAAMNLSSLAKYGSLELRALRTPQTPDKIIEFLEAFDLLKNNSLNFGSPTEVLNAMSADGIEQFVKQVLGEKSYLVTQQENFQQKIENNLRNIQFWVYTTNWETN